MQEDKTKEKNPKREKPLSLFPLTMDEALKKALDTPPPKDGKKKRSTKSNVESQ